MVIRTATSPDIANEQRLVDIDVLRQRLKSLGVAAVPNAGHAVITDNREFVTTSVWAFLSRVWL